MAGHRGLWTLREMVPNIVATSSDHELHAMARYFEETDREDSVDVVRFLRKFAKGTLVGDLKQLADGWSRLTALDSERTAAFKRRDAQVYERIGVEFKKIGILPKDSKDPKTGEVITSWEVAR